MLLFDTGKKLEKAFTKEQFAALVEVLESREDKAASKAELSETGLRLQKEIEGVRSDLRETELRLQKEIEGVRKETEAIRSDLRQTELRLQKDIATSRAETIKWMAGLMVAQSAAIIAAVIAIVK